ncbi:MAG: hypothetical protein K2P76_13035 [Lachnospiraceae bacterium]|nr:hypothetical protein [Lachnospiraceae bacterium]
MNTKTMEGLVGASTNMKNMDTPMRVFRDARRRGDISVMKRAMGYAADYAEEAYDYYDKAEKGMEEDAKEAREKAKEFQEKAIQKRREEQEKLNERLEKLKEPDTVEVSEEGKGMLEENPDLAGSLSGEIKSENSTDMVTYTKDGRVIPAFPGGENIDIAVTD